MPQQRTLSIIKPDAVVKNQIGPIYHRITAAGLWIVAAKMQQLTLAQAECFYGIHQDRPFFHDLVRFMSSGPVMLQILASETAVSRYRSLMGTTDPKQAAPNTLRADFGTSVDRNAVHGSDSEATARYEIALLFREFDIYPLGDF